MLSLASFRYREILSGAGGPVDQIEMADSQVLGQREFLANVRLRAGLAADPGSGMLYSTANGSAARTRYSLGYADTGHGQVRGAAASTRYRLGRMAQPNQRQALYSADRRNSP